MADTSGGGPLPRPTVATKLDPFSIHVLDDGTSHLMLDDTVEFTTEDARAGVQRFGVMPVSDGSESVLYIHGGEVAGRERLCIKGETYDALDLALNVWGTDGSRTDVNFHAVVLNFPESQGIVRPFAEAADAVADRTIAVFGLWTIGGQEEIVFSEDGVAGTIGSSALGEIGQAVTSREPKTGAASLVTSVGLGAAEPGRQFSSATLVV